MDGANADSDHSMTWEDFFGSTTDLTPTLIGIYDSLLEPAKSPEVSRFDLTAKDARNNPPLKPDTMIEEMKTPLEVQTKLPGVKLPIANVNKSSLYSLRTKVESESVASDLPSSDSTLVNKNNLRVMKTEQKVSEVSAFNTLSPNVKRMISSATETTGNALKFQKRTATVGRSSGRGHRSNIPLVGATSKITQSRVELPSSVEIYDLPSKTFNKSKSEEPQTAESPSKIQKIKPEFKLNVQETYDVPTNNRSVIYDIPLKNSKTAFESLSLPYIDQSIELSISTNDREFDIKLNSKDNTPEKVDKTKSPEQSPLKLPRPVNGGTNSLNRKEFNAKTETPIKQLAKTVPYPEVVGSTGNLKAVPEKEVPRLNPPTVEVSRPLSMSSIASSSSTSSSGVQNKGGVNSAYLASIESLDDHSDADVTSGNGSNIFVNNAGMMNKSASEERHSDTLSREPDEMSGLTQLELVCAEIVHTENVYVQDLQQVVEGYLHEWKREMTFSEEELSEVFNNIEDIYTFNRSLCDELNTCRLDATCIARCFVNNTSGFSVYASYCTGYPRTMARLAALASEPRSAREFRERQVALGHPLPLASYLLKPVQRLLKYHLLLQNVVKQCASRETEYALLKMTGIAQHIDDMKRRHEHAVRVQEIQSLLYGWNGPDLTTYGELCAEGTFRVFGAKAMRHAFLFDKMLLITKNREDGILAYKMHIMCNNMMLVESIAGAPLSFHVIPWDAPRSQLTLQARSPRHKREWTLLLKRVILENYNAVIPSHARQIVMELGQNKTDDDMLAEKSHNLITQASMRKQLSAPEYLEKRKLERERRKSFENGIRGRLKKVNRKYTVPVVKTTLQDCDCAQVSLEKGIDYTCDSCYIDLCSDCEVELSSKDKKDECACRHEVNDGEKCAECDRALHFIDAGSTEHIERKGYVCKCAEFKSSQEIFSKDSLNKTRGYHSSDNIVGYADSSKSKEDLTETNNSMTNVRNIPKTCLKCAKIKENIVVTDSTSALHNRRSRCNDLEKHRSDTLRSKSKEDSQRSKLSKIGTWRRKSEPGLQQNPGLVPKRSQDSDSDRQDMKGTEKIEFECRNCGSNKINKKGKANPSVMISDPELENPKRAGGLKSNLDIKVYTTKNIPKKISKLKKSRAKGVRLGSDTTAKFYADLSTDVSTENILHITESTDSLIDKTKGNENTKATLNVPETISKDDDIDEETYKKLIEKTDSFKKNELEKVKYLNKQNVINEGSEIEGDKVEIEVRRPQDVVESCEETEQPLEQIISQLLMQNREFQKLLKKQQVRNSAQRRHQRLLKSHSNPEQTITTRSGDWKFKPKYSRQMSENLDLTTVNVEEKAPLSPPQEVDDASDEDHIYETLRVDNRVDETLHSLNNKSKSIQHNPRVSRPKRLPSPPNSNLNLPEITPKIGTHDSDYVYLSFDKLNKLQDDTDGIYDVPVKSPQKVQEKTADYYVTMEKSGPMNSKENIEDLYDNIIEVCRRKKDAPSTVTSDYLPMGPEPQSPNTPEIWLSRQKEHFNVSRDRKSGSLPRSFQVPVNNPEEANLSTFKSKPNSNSKTYLNRDGKVMSNDRPYTIASDQSEISYDDVENYMSEGDILKFNKGAAKSNDVELQNISQSTLELEEEIDRCYKNNFEANLDPNKNEFLLNVSQRNLDISTTSSCEVLPAEQIDAKKPTDIEVIHPEHKIYKPTGNLLSLKNVLSRFKSKNPNKSTEESEMNANDPSSPDSTKSDPKSPNSEKRSALNPRSYSKNLLQRFRSIIGDEHPDDNHNRSESPNRQNKKLIEELQNNLKNDIKVVITSTEASPTIASLVYSTNDALSKSTYETTTLTESQNEKNNLEALSHSCDDIAQKQDQNRPVYEKSISLVTNISNSVSSTASPSKSNNSSFQSLNKLPVYMQGSKHLGARIAQSDYVDPTTLMSEKAGFNNVNVLINKNAVRPDSLFSNSSFATSSSEGNYKEGQNKVQDNIQEVKEPKASDTSMPGNSDESYYEKSFEKIEHVTDDDVFRDSAVYSDQEDGEDSKTESSAKHKHISRTTSRVESIKRESSFRTQKTSVTSSITENKTSQTRVLVTTSQFQHLEKVNLTKEKTVQTTEKTKPKVAPPVPVKPKMTSIPTTSNFHTRNVVANRSFIKSEENSSSSESVNMKTIKRNTNLRQSCVKSQPASVEDKSKAQTTAKEVKADTVQKLETVTDETNSKTNTATDSKPKTTNMQTDSKINATVESIPKTSNIQLKRLSFERASLDSATRKSKPQIESKRSSVEPAKVTSKTVLERRMEIESMTKTVQRPNHIVKKPSQIAKPKSMTTKVSPFERSVSEMGARELKISKSVDTSAIPHNDNEDQNKDLEVERGSWVKTVVNKFQ